MLIKLIAENALSLKREKVARRSITKSDRIKGDRYVMMTIFLIGIVCAVIFA